MNNYDYPEGSDNSAAPWNNEEKEEITINVSVSTTLSKNTTLTTSDYEIDNEVDYIEGERGKAYPIVKDCYDFSNTEFNRIYHNQEYTIPELLHELVEILKVNIKNKEVPAWQIQVWKNMINNAKGWHEDELEIIEDI